MVGPIDPPVAIGAKHFDKTTQLQTDPNYVIQQTALPWTLCEMGTAIWNVQFAKMV